MKPDEAIRRLAGSGAGPPGHRPSYPHRRLRELCALHRLPAGAFDRLDALLRLLDADQHAPTTVRDPAAAVDVHVADSLAALALPSVRAACEVVDLGTGAGFPGIPLAVALPGARFALLEASRRRCEFLSTVLLQLRLENCAVVGARAEDWPEGLGRHDLVLARAVSSQAVVLEYAAPLLALGGSLVEWRGERDLDAEQDAASAATTLGLQARALELVRPYPAARSHHLHVFAKVAATPAAFPRRPGLARKRPLRGSSAPGSPR
ncbi:MAG: 16S rRNA (guanine(527)-N(7))-methyltransferase RsmG [Solirubrobacteraceae bacterium]